MASIADFVVALTVDKDGFEKGIKQAEAGLQNFSSTALQVGATLAGAFSFKAMTVDFSKQNLALDQFAKKVGVTRDEVYGLDQAAQAFGANAGETTRTLERLADIRAGLIRGEAGAIESVAKSGLSPDAILGAKNPYEALLNIAERYKTMTRDQRINLAKDLGLSDAQMDMLSQGRDKVRKLADEMVKNRRHTKDMADSARDFTKAWVEMTNSIGGAIDPLAKSVTDLSADIMRFFTENTSEGTKFRDIIKEVAGHVNELAIVLGVLVAGRTVAGLGQLAIGIGRIGKALGLLRLANPWILGLTALAGLGYHAFSEKTVKKNSDELLGDTQEKKLRTIELIGQGYSEDEAYDMVEEEFKNRPQSPDVVTPPDVVATHDEAATPPDVLPNHAEAKAQVEEKTAPKVSREEPREKPKPKPEKRVEVKSAPDGSKTMTVNLVLDGRVIDQRVFRIMGDAIKEVKETSRRTTAR